MICLRPIRLAEAGNHHTDRFTSDMLANHEDFPLARRSPFRRINIGEKANRELNRFSFERFTQGIRRHECQSPGADSDCSFCRDQSWGRGVMVTAFQFSG